MAPSSYRSTLAVSLVALLGCSGSSAKLEIAGLTCGTSVEEIKRLYPSSALRSFRMPDGTQVVAARLVAPPFAYIDVSADPERGVHGMMAQYTVVAGEQWPTVRKDLVARHGEPSSTRDIGDPSSEGEMLVWGKCTATGANLAPRLVGSGCCLSAVGLYGAASKVYTSVTLTMRQASK